MPEAPFKGQLLRQGKQVQTRIRPRSRHEPNRALIASGTCGASSAFLLDLMRGSKITHMTRAESAQTVLRHLAVTTSSKFKRGNFGGELCVRWRQFDRGQPGSVPLISRGDRPNCYLVCQRNVAALKYSDPESLESSPPRARGLRVRRCGALMT